MAATMSNAHGSPFEGDNVPHTLIDLLQRRARRRPDDVAYTFLDEAGAVSATLTYQELDRRARAIAARLGREHARGDRALLLYGPGLDFHVAFFGCLYAGVVAVPVNPPRMNRNFGRLIAVTADAEVRFILTTSPLIDGLRRAAGRAPDLNRIQWIATETVEADADEYPQGAAAPDAVAFLQYTSGSTGTPRGVQLTHANLLHNAQLVYEATECTPADKYVSWLPTFHDMGFMVGLLEPLYAGVPVVLMAPASFLQSPRRWLQAITDHRATLSGGPNFAYRLCAGRIGPEQRQTLNLENWRFAFNGAEPVRARTLDEFARVFSPHGFRERAFYSCYGLAEATLLVSGAGAGRPLARKTFSRSALEAHRAEAAGESDDDGARLVSCGRVLGGQRLAIVNPNTGAPCQSDEVGEIWVSGPSVAGGYWNRPEENRRAFGARLEQTGEGPFLRTGDLGFLEDGELYVTGRLKDMIIIRGANYYPQDIEEIVEGVDPALRAGCGAAFSIDVESDEGDGEERLVIVQEIERREGFDPDAVIDLIRKAVSEKCELQAHTVALIRKGTIPKTSSGKIQRHACKAAFLNGELREIARDCVEAREEAPAEEASVILKTLLAIPAEARQAPLEAYLREQAARLLKTPSGRLETDVPLASFGLDSLIAAEFKNVVEDDLRVSVSLSRLLDGAAIADLAREAVQQLSAPPAVRKSAGPVGPAAPSGSGAPLSHMQRSLWLTQQLAPASPAYNVPIAIRIEAPVNREALRMALQDIVDRHASLRTTFDMGADGPVQVIHARQQVTFEEIDCAGEADKAMTDLAHEPFDLERGPVFRAALFSRSDRDHTLLLMAHHLVTDGRSMWILLEETLTLYQARAAGRDDSLPRLACDYSDFVQWQAAALDGPEGDAVLSYWRNELQDIPTLDFPMARRRPPVRTFDGDEVRFNLDRELAEGLGRLAAANRTTLYVVLLTAFELLLHRYAHTDDIVIGSPVQGRPSARFEGVAGCFFNVVALRSVIAGDPTFSDLLAQTRGKVLAALERQHYPSHLLAEKLVTARDPSRSPLFSVSFILQKPVFGASGTPFRMDEGLRADFGDLPVRLVPVEKKCARNDLELEILEAEGGLFCSLQFNTSLFRREDMKRLAAHYSQLLGAAAASPGMAVSRLSMAAEDERERILGRWSKGKGGYSLSTTVDAMFDAQVAKTPGKIAAVHRDASLTFSQLNDDAARLAALIENLTQR